VLTQYVHMEREGRMSKKRPVEFTRREFVELAGVAGSAWGLSLATAAGAAESVHAPVDGRGKVIPGLDAVQSRPDGATGWEPFSD